MDCSVSTFAPHCPDCWWWWYPGLCIRIGDHSKTGANQAVSLPPFWNGLALQAPYARMFTATIPVRVPTKMVFWNRVGVAKRDAAPTEMVARTEPVAALRA